MSNPTVSFRLSDYQLARALRAIRTLEPNWQLVSTSDLVRTIFNDYIAKSENLNNHPLIAEPALLNEIIQTRLGTMNQKTSEPKHKPFPSLGNQTTPLSNQIHQTKPDWQIRQEAEQDKLFQEMRQESLTKKLKQEQDQTKEESQNLDSQIDLAHKSINRLSKASEFDDPNITESSISAITDFSIPSDMLPDE